MKTLALGKKDSAFYKSISQAMYAFGDITYRSEHDFPKLVQLINYIEEKNINQVLMPNPYGNNKRLATYRKLKELKIPVIASDRGGLPGSWFFDSGFNADSESYNIEKWDKKLSSKEKEKASIYIKNLVSTEDALEKQGNRVGGESLRRSLRLEGKKSSSFLFRGLGTRLSNISTPTTLYQNLLQAFPCLLIL